MEIDKGADVDKGSGTDAGKGERAKGSRTRVPPSLGMINIGYGNLVLAARVVAIVAPGSAPMKRLRDEAFDRGKLIDATMGRRTRSILVTDSDHVVLSAINPETIATRLAQELPGESDW